VQVYSQSVVLNNLQNETYPFKGLDLFDPCCKAETIDPAIDRTIDLTGLVGSKGQLTSLYQHWLHCLGAFIKSVTTMQQALIQTVNNLASRIATMPELQVLVPIC